MGSVVAVNAGGPRRVFSAADPPRPTQDRIGVSPEGYARPGKGGQMTVPARTSVACLAVVAGLIVGLSHPRATVGKPRGEAFVTVGELPDGLSVVYLFRKPQSSFDLQVVFANGRLVAGMTPGTYVSLLVPPGELFLKSTYPSPRDFPLHVLDITLNVAPGREYYLIEPFFHKTGLMEPENDKALQKRIRKSGVRSREPGYAGFSHYYQADVFLDLAATQDEAGQREAAASALRGAAKHYGAAASGFGLPIPKEKKWKAFFKELGGTLGPLVREMQARQLANKLGEAAAPTGGSNWSDAQRRAAMDAYIDIAEQTVGKPLDPSNADAETALSGGFDALAKRMEERASIASTALACYTGEDEPSLRQCWIAQAPGDGSERFQQAEGQSDR